MLTGRERGPKNIRISTKKSGYLPPRTAMRPGAHRGRAQLTNMQAETRDSRVSGEAGNDQTLDSSGDNDVP
jgi:hypothetical protein